MNNLKKVTVILTSYNHANFLREAIDSVLNQTYTEFDLIIWDDGSTDESWQIITSYADPRIQAFKNETLVRGAPIRNAVSEVETGEYIAIQHSDDVWEPQKLEKQVAFLDENPPVGAVFTWAQIIDENGANLPEDWFIQDNKTQWQWLRQIFRGENHLNHPSVLIRKICYQEVGLYRFGFPQTGDAEMWVRLLLKYPIHVIKERLTKHRLMSDVSNASSSRPDNRIRMQFEFYKLLQNYRKLTSFDDLVKIFPSAEKYDRKEETDIDLALALVVLEEGAFPYTQLFGLDILFEIISDPKRSANIERLYNFDYKTFITLTGKYDVFSQEILSELQRAVVERDGKITNMSTLLAEKQENIQTLTNQVAEKEQSIQTLSAQLDNIINSKLWKSALLLRQFRVAITLTLFNRRVKRDLNLIKSSSLFDERWYLAHNPDVVVAKIDPGQHYLLYGGFEGRDPCPHFYSARYLNTYRDVKHAGINPLVHYLKYGKKEGRAAQPDQVLLSKSLQKSSEPVKYIPMMDGYLSIGKENNPPGQKLKIVLLVHQFVPEYSSGTEVLTYETAKALQKQGHDVIVFTGFPAKGELKDSERFDRYIHDGIRVERFRHSYTPMGDQSNVLEMEYNNKLFGSYFREFLKYEKPDLVHFFHLSRLSATPIDACKELGIPTVMTPTDFWLICHASHLRWPDNQPCPGPDKYGVNCLRHVVAIHQFTRVDMLFQKLPDWVIATLIFVIKRGFNFDNKYSPYVRALANRREFLRARMNRVDKLVVPTRVMMSSLIQNGLEIQRTIPIPFGLNLSYLQNAKRPAPDNVLRLGYIGTLYEHKGVHVLVEAIKKLEGKPIELNIYGNLNDFPDYVEGLRKIVQSDPRIKFCGTFPNHEIGLIFSGLDALVVPSLWHENAPLVIYSAQAASCPVIASNKAGMSEVIEHGKNGLLFEAGNVDDLVTTIETLLDDNELLLKLSNHARKPLSIQEYALKLLDVYRNLIEKEKPV